MNFHNKITVSLSMVTLLLTGCSVTQVAGPVEQASDPVTGMEFVSIPGGCFQRGDQFGEGANDEKPTQEVCVEGFFMGKYEITVSQWRSFIAATDYKTDAEGDVGGKKGCYSYHFDKWDYHYASSWRLPGFSQTDKDPVICVSYNDVNRYIAWLNQVSGKQYRLPTFTEQEYAARGGAETNRYWGNERDDKACLYENFMAEGEGWRTFFPCEDGKIHTAPVGSYKPNPYGFHDIMGNVMELLSDSHNGQHFAGGGCWYSNPDEVKDPSIVSLEVNDRSSIIGFRLVFPNSAAMDPETKASHERFLKSQMLVEAFGINKKK
jgi:serine/threonine-protein kinase PpkA